MAASAATVAKAPNCVGPMDPATMPKTNDLQNQAHGHGRP